MQPKDFCDSQWNVCKCQLVFWFEWCLLSTSYCSSFYRFRSELIKVLLRIVQSFAVWAFWLIFLLKDPQPATKPQLSETGQHISLQTSESLELIGLLSFNSLLTFCIPCSVRAANCTMTTCLLTGRMTNYMIEKTWRDLRSDILVSHPFGKIIFITFLRPISLVSYI